MFIQIYLFLRVKLVEANSAVVIFCQGYTCCSVFASLYTHCSWRSYVSQRCCAPSFIL